MVEPQSSLHAGRSKILEPDEKVDGRQYTLEDLMAKIEANPSNQRLLKQFGVRESVKRCLGAKGRHLAEYEMEDPRVVAVITSLMGWEAMCNSLRRN